MSSHVRDVFDLESPGFWVCCVFVVILVILIGCAPHAPGDDTCDPPPPGGQSFCHDTR